MRYHNSIITMYMIEVYMDYKKFVRDRITELRIKKNKSEYAMSLDLGLNRSYVQSISSSKSLPSMERFLEICEYFELTPCEFFDTTFDNPKLLSTFTEEAKKLTDEDLLALIAIMKRMRGKDEG